MSFLGHIITDTCFFWVKFVPRAHHSWGNFILGQFVYIYISLLQICSEAYPPQGISTPGQISPGAYQPGAYQPWVISARPISARVISAPRHISHLNHKLSILQTSPHPNAMWGYGRWTCQSILMTMHCGVGDLLYFTFIL